MISLDAALAISNPRLYDALLKEDYPLPDYEAFAVAWPHRASAIKELHAWIKMAPHKRALFREIAQ